MPTAGVGADPCVRPGVVRSRRPGRTRGSAPTDAPDRKALSALDSRGYGKGIRWPLPDGGGDAERLILRQLPLQAQRDATGLPEQDVAGQADRLFADVAASVA